VTSTASVDNLTIDGGTAIVTGTVEGDLVNNRGTLIVAAPGDLNLSGTINVDDIDALYAQFSDSVPEVHARFDLVGDGVVNGEDLDLLIHDLMAREYGDADLDGDVDIADFNRLAQAFDPLGTRGFNG